jgi:AmmeMemoRadiSam system protein A
MNKVFSETDKKILLQAARTAVLKQLSGEDFNYSDELKKFSDKTGVFVTLKKNGNLRGCIGNILPEKALFKAVVENALNSAFHDPRFTALSKEELEKVEIEISILTVPEKIDYKDKKDLETKIIPFEHGVILNFGRRQSTFLPSVWEELPDFEMFMSHLSMKAGFNPLDWKILEPEVFVYKAQHFCESDLKV